MSAGEGLGTRCFGWEDQHRFAEFSGDRNPMHMDPVAARRTQAGAPVVHGVHCLLWALDRYAAARPAMLPVAKLQVKFARLVHVGDTAELVLVAESDRLARLQVRVGEAVTLVAALAFGPAGAAAFEEERLGEPLQVTAPVERTWSKAAEAAGWLAGPEVAAAGDAFPAAAGALGAARVAGLAAMTEWVGMVNPGLHSIFTGLTLAAVEPAEPGVTFRVARAEERYRMLSQAVAGAGWQGTVESLLRLSPIMQAGMDAVRAQVEPGEFAGVSALVVGASRGLGEVTAKLIAAGGGQVTGTYALGREDAERVAGEIGPACTMLPLRLGDDETLPELPPGLNAIFYCATPPVTARGGTGYDAELLDRYLSVYARGFAQVCAAVAAGPGGMVAAFSPSTVYVDGAARPDELVEYAMAKAAAEVLVEELPRRLPRLRTLSVRLPRVATDLSASAFEAAAGDDPLETMLPIVRQVKQLLGLQAQP